MKQIKETRSEKRTRELAEIEEAVRVDPSDIEGNAKLYKRKQALTCPLVSLAHTPHLHFRVLGAIQQSIMPNFARNETGTVPLMEIVNLHSGEIGKLIVNSMLASALEHFGDYVGHSFEVLATEPRPGKPYRDVTVWEIEK